MQVKIRLS